MSALPPKADMCGAARDVRFGPKADMAQIEMSLGPPINYNYRVSPAREKNSDEDRCDDRKRMTVSCHYDGEQDREYGNKNYKAERAGHRFDLRCASAA
jgi:hypothetical protein